MFALERKHLSMLCSEELITHALFSRHRPGYLLFKETEFAYKRFFCEQ